jgi:virulence-associated protein VapD
MRELLEEYGFEEIVASEQGLGYITTDTKVDVEYDNEYWAYDDIDMNRHYFETIEGAYEFLIDNLM